MNTARKRLSALSAYLLTVLMGIALAMTVASLLHRPVASPRFAIRDVRVVFAMDNFSRETKHLALLTFDFDAGIFLFLVCFNNLLSILKDLRPLFDWNTKMIYASVTATWKTDKMVRKVPLFAVFLAQGKATLGG